MTSKQTSEHLLVVKAWLEMEIDASEAAISVSKTSDMNEEARNHMQELANVKWAIEDKLIERHGGKVRGLLERLRKIPNVDEADMTIEQLEEYRVLQSEFDHYDLGMPRDNQRFDTEKDLAALIISGRLGVDEMLTPSMRGVIDENKMGLLVGKPGAIMLGTLRLALRNLLEPPIQPSNSLEYPASMNSEEYKKAWNKDKADIIYQALGIKEAEQGAFSRGYHEVLQSVGKLPFWNQENRQLENLVGNFSREYGIGLDASNEGTGEIYVDGSGLQTENDAPSMWNQFKEHGKYAGREIFGYPQPEEE